VAPNEPGGVEKPGSSGGEPGGETHAPAQATTTQPELRPEGKEPDYKQLYLTKTKNLEEEVNRLRAERESREALAPAAPADSFDTQLQEDFVRLQDRDPEAARVLQAIVEAQDLTRRQLESKLQQALDRAEIPIDERDEVERHFKANRHRLGDLKGARAELRAVKLEAENRQLREQAEARTTRQPDPDVIRTMTREVPASDAKQRRKMTGEQFDAEAARLEAAGDVTGAMKLRGQFNRGEIEIS